MDDQLVQQLVAEIGSQRPSLQKNYPQIKTSEGRPRQYYWTEKSDQTQIHEAEQGSQTAVPVGTVLHRCRRPIYIRFLQNTFWSDLTVLSKRIDDKKSSNKQGPSGNRWLFPDLVGMEDLTAELHQEIKHIITEYGDRKTRLWSFEVKLLLNRSNVREAFFQAVSNSSWANLGYLVAAEIEGSATMKELRMPLAFMVLASSRSTQKTLPRAKSSSRLASEPRLIGLPATAWPERIGTFYNLSA